MMRLELKTTRPGEDLSFMIWDQPDQSSVLSILSQVEGRLNVVWVDLSEARRLRDALTEALDGVA